MAAASATVRWQSFVDPVAQRGYVRALEAYLAEIAGPRIDYEVVGVTPGAGSMHALTEWRCAATLVDNAVRAEADGCAAFVTGHFPDPAIAELRARLEIPVLGLGEASLLTAATLARRTGIVTIHPAFVPITELQVRRLGLSDRLAGVGAMRLELEEITAAFEDERARDAIVEKLDTASVPIVELGAELIVVGSGTQLMLVRERGLTAAGVPVLNGIAALTTLAESTVRLRRC